MYISQDILETMRRVLIQFLGLIEDALQRPRSISDKNVRRPNRPTDDFESQSGIDRNWKNK